MTPAQVCLWLGKHAVTSYVIDVPVRRAFEARKARAYADARKKPLLNVGAGTGRSALFGETLYGDVNLDVAAPKTRASKDRVVYGDAADLSEYPDGCFGAVLASHVLEHLEDPDRALREWLRVVGGDARALFVVTPSWWAPHTWLHPGHRYYFTDGRGGLDGGRMVRLRAPAPVPTALLR